MFQESQSSSSTFYFIPLLHNVTTEEKKITTTPIAPLPKKEATVSPTFKCEVVPINQGLIVNTQENVENCITGSQDHRYI